MRGAVRCLAAVKRGNGIFGSVSAAEPDQGKKRTSEKRSNIAKQPEVSLDEDFSILFNPRNIDIDAFEKEMVRCADFISIAMQNNELLDDLEGRLVAVDAEIVTHADVYRKVDEAKVIVVFVLEGFCFFFIVRNRTMSG